MGAAIKKHFGGLVKAYTDHIKVEAFTVHQMRCVYTAWYFSKEPEGTYYKDFISRILGHSGSSAAESYEYIKHKDKAHAAEPEPEAMPDTVAPAMEDAEPEPEAVLDAVMEEAQCQRRT